MKKFIRNCTIALLGALFFTSSTCDPGEEFEFEKNVIVNNQTDEDIMILSAIDSYPNLIGENLKSLYYYRHRNTKILSANNATVLNTFFWFEDNGTPKYDTLLVMIIRRSTLDKFPFDYIIENNIYDDFLIFSYDELKSMDFQIIYKN